ncbi:MAG TPA: hypothetical protein VFW87_17225 [Pirellulales bacterium]|nr:hypothetical protein [Pirellulales bacterium]
MSIASQPRRSWIARFACALALALSTPHVAHSDPPQLAAAGALAKTTGTRPNPLEGLPPASAPLAEFAAQSGVVFSGNAAEVARVAARMQQLLAQLGWTADQVRVQKSPQGSWIGYSLNSAPHETDTFALARQPRLGLAPEMVAYVDRHGAPQTMALVSQKEILAAMLQAGRLFVFRGEHCSVDKLQEHLAIRQNIVYWGSRTDWVFPEDKIYRFNTADFWQPMTGDDWTLKPGVRASQAIADAFTGKFDYQIGCTSACRFIATHGVLDYYHRVQASTAMIARLEQALDPQRPFVEITPTVDRDGTYRKAGRLFDRQFNVPWNHWVPGDWGWIKNLDPKSSEELGSEGCNIIYAGGGIFVNYYPERPPKTLDESLRRVYGWQFGLEEGELAITPEVAARLRQDPRAGGMLRDVRDVPKLFGASAAPPTGA